MLCYLLLYSNLIALRNEVEYTHDGKAHEWLFASGQQRHAYN